MELKAGDVLLTPEGRELPVRAVDHITDQVTLVDGQVWGFADIEEPLRPDVRDTEELERWLRIAAVVIPRRKFQNRNVVCSCKCGVCYCVETWDALPNTTRIDNLQVHHFRNNDRCDCHVKECPCLRY